MKALSYLLDAQHMSRDPLARRVIVRFVDVGSGPDMVLEYAATPPEACEFARAAARTGLSVTVDCEVTDELRPLPCRSLWR